MYGAQTLGKNLKTGGLATSKYPAPYKPRYLPCLLPAL